MSKSNKYEFQLDTDLLSLRAFVAVVEAGSFSAAAKRIHRTQSAVSLQIAKLEERLDIKLLNRSTRSVSVTSAGETFMSYVRRILDLADEAALAVTSPDESSLLRVGFAEYLAPQHLHKLLARFRRAHPNCDLSLVLGLGNEMVASLESGDLDVVFACPEVEGGELLWEEPMVWTGINEHNDSLDKPIELVLMPSPCSYRKIALDALTSAGKSWKMSMEANSVQAVQAAVRAGLGMSVLPLSAVHGEMPILRNNLPQLPNTSVMSYFRPNLSHPYAQRFVNFFCSCIEDNDNHIKLHGKSGSTSDQELIAAI